MSSNPDNLFDIGDKVILGRHNIMPGSSTPSNWSPTMEQYVGKLATITKIYSKSMYNVDIYNGRWVWHGVNMTPVKPKPSAFSQAAKSDGAFCGKCHDFIAYVEPVPNFTCYFCRH